MLLQKEILLSSIRLHKLFPRTLFFYARPVRLAYKPYFFSQRTIFFSHNKSANSTFSHGLSAKRIGPVEGIWRNLEEFGREWTVFSAMNSECRLILRAVERGIGVFLAKEWTLFKVHLKYEQEQENHWYAKQRFTHILLSIHKRNSHISKG